LAASQGQDYRRRLFALLSDGSRRRGLRWPGPAGMRRILMGRFPLPPPLRVVLPPQPELRLDGKIAYKIAERLGNIRGGPRTKVTIEGVARELVRLCRGGHYKGEYWPPSRQAHWLEHEICFWEKWKGPAGMRRILMDRFPLPPALNTASRPPERQGHLFNYAP
jgi:hypothetical protein